MMTGGEITEALPLMDEFGRPVNFGWARSPLFEYNFPLMGGPSRTRIADSDRFIIFSTTHIIVFDVVDGGLLGYQDISVVSIKDHHYSTHTIESLFPFGRFNLPIADDSIRLREKNTLMDFIVMKSGARIIRVDIPHFGRHRYLRGEVVLSPPPGAQSIVTSSPWRREKYAFRLARCSPWFTVEGVMQFGTSELYFTRDNAWGIHDRKREVRPRRDTRLWAAACGTASRTANGRASGSIGDSPADAAPALVGFNIGYGSSDGSAGTENAFFFNGVIHKLDQVTFHIPGEWLDEWKFTSSDQRLEMTFNPGQQRTEYRSVFFHSVACRQVYGTFSGRVILDDGSPLAFWNITGFAERRKTRF